MVGHDGSQEGGGVPPPGSTVPGSIAPLPSPRCGRPEPVHEVRQPQHHQRMIVAIPGPVQHRDGQLIGRGAGLGLGQGVEQPGGQRGAVFDF